MEEPRKILISTSPSVRAEYAEAVIAAGGVPDSYYLPGYLKDSKATTVDQLCRFLSKKYDGLILSGGGDVNPARYNEKLNGSANIDNERDEIEFGLIQEFMKSGKPIMGICRGIQVMNVALGGTLNQDNGAKCNQRHTSADSTDKVHSTYCEPSFLYDLYGETFNVNSHHHQSIKELGKGLKIIQYTPDDNCIEGVMHESYPYIGVQWHPERLCQPSENKKVCVDGATLFQYFVSLV